MKSENNYKNLIIINQLEDVFSENIDFINFGSSIEYFDNYEFILEKLTNIGKIIFFSGTTLFETENKKYEKHMVVKQINLYPDINYLYFFNKKNLYQIFLKKNFNLLFEKKNITDDVDYKNFNKFFDKINYMDFLFIKKG